MTSTVLMKSRMGYLHELRDGSRHDVDVSNAKAGAAVDTVAKSVKGIRLGVYPAAPENDKCSECDYRLICKSCPVGIT